MTCPSASSISFAIFAPAQSSPPFATPAPAGFPLPAGAGLIVVSTDISGPSVEYPVADWNHPESIYCRRHPNCDDGDLRDLPSFTRFAASRFRRGRP